MSIGAYTPQPRVLGEAAAGLAGQGPVAKGSSEAREFGRSDPGFDGERGRQDGCDFQRHGRGRGRDIPGPRHGGEDRSTRCWSVVLREAQGDRCGRATDCADVESCLAWRDGERREREDLAARWVGHRARAPENACVDGATRRDATAKGFNFPWMQVAAPDTNVDEMV